MFNLVDLVTGFSWQCIIDFKKLKNLVTGFAGWGGGRWEL